MHRKINGYIDMIDNSIYYNSLKRVTEVVSESNKSFLITGSSGLIGSCLVDLLMLANQEGRNNHIFALGRNKEKIKSRFPEYIGNDYFHILEQDICEPLPKEYNFDYIVHGASNADPVSYAKYPVETILTNLLGTKNVLDYGRLNKECMITLLSTFEVYGKCDKDIYCETDAGVINFNLFRSCYPESKRTSEILSRSYVDEYKVKVNVARLCSIYGPTMSLQDSKAHAQFLRNALKGEDIVLKSTGAQRRTYCYVIDAITAILTILFKGSSGYSYNVSNINSIISIADLATLIASLSGKKIVYDLPSKIESKGFSKPQDCILDNSELCKLGWQGLYGIKEGIIETLDILKQDPKIGLTL